MDIPFAALEGMSRLPETAGMLLNPRQALPLLLLPAVLLLAFAPLLSWLQLLLC